MASDSESSSSQDMGEQVRITLKLSAECADRDLVVPAEPIAVPADVSRKGLSAVINHLLDRRLPADDDDDDEKDDRLPHITFDFTIGKSSRLLRTPLEREARRAGISLETAIPITYFPAQEAPELRGESEKLPDWISSLSFSGDFLCAGCYDGSLHVFDTNPSTSDSPSCRKANHLKGAHKGPIQCLDLTNDENGFLITSGSMDHTLKVHYMERDSRNIKLVGNCLDGHAASISCVDVLPQQDLLASGDWDGGVCLWRLDSFKMDPSEENPQKKSKTATSYSSEKGTPALSPFVSLQAHSSKVSGVSWGNREKNQEDFVAETLITGSWDHSLKVWNVERADCVLTLNGSRVIGCLDTSYFNSGVVATGHPDCTIRLWDARTDDSKESAVALSDNSFRPSHSGWVSAVRWSRRNPYHLASTSLDGTVKLWDIRSSIPLHTVRVFEKGEKGLALVYGAEGFLYGGGTDCELKQLQQPTTNFKET